MTQSTKLSNVNHSWQKVDVKGKILGRAAVDIAHKLMGKGKTYFVRNLDCGDYVVVTNAAQVVVTGKKEKQKRYNRHSGYPGGFKSETLEELRARKPQDIIIHAVKGMLPQNKLRASMLKRLFVFPATEHNYNDKFEARK